MPSTSEPIEAAAKAGALRQPVELRQESGRSLPRALGRLLWLGAEILLAFARYLLLFIRARGNLTAAERAQWLHASARRHFRVFATQTEVRGDIPRSGLLVANHLTYLDILLIASLTPARFVSKSEVNAWPVFGFLARCAGTIFIDRTRRHDTGRANEELKEALAGGGLVVLFPEGTSSDGQTVLPFRSSLLAPAVNTHVRVVAAHLSYALPEGAVRQDVCYWGDMTLGPHLLNLISKGWVSARIAFAPCARTAVDRKELARQLHAEVLRMKQQHSL